MMAGGIKINNEEITMKKILISSIIFCSPIIAYANTLNLPTQEPSITPMSMLDIPEEMKKDIARRQAEEKIKGYQEEDFDYARYLLKLESNAKAEIKSFNATKDPYDTHLKNNASIIRLAFNFKPLTLMKKENIIGYAPLGSYVESGWTGIKAFFKESQLGTCAYSYFDLAASHGAAELNGDLTEYLINKQPSSKSIRGSLNSGFVYEVTWFGKTSMSQLECANYNFDKEFMSRLIVLAEKIDGR